MFGKVWFLKRYHSNNQCTVTKSFTGYCTSDLIKFQCKDIFVYKLKTLLLIRTLFHKYDNKYKNNLLKVKVKLTEARNWHKISDFCPYLSKFLHDLV